MSGHTSPKRAPTNNPFVLLEMIAFRQPKAQWHLQVHGCLAIVSFALPECMPFVGCLLHSSFMNNCTGG
jgi:hypothetical protein